jgi:hypothetical protein
MGGMGLMRLPCCTICPLASLDEDKAIYTTNCGASKNEIKVLVEKIAPEKSLHIIGQQ